MEEEMRNLGINAPVEEVGPVSDTHDEAVAVAELAHKRHWNELILVTQSWHMRRAGDLFEKAGIHVLRSPCTEGRYDLKNLTSPGVRLWAFRDWLHETVGYVAYRLRGWV